MANFSRHCFLWKKPKISLFTRTHQYHISLASVAQKSLFFRFEQSFAGPLIVSLEKWMHSLTLVLWSIGMEPPNKLLQFLRLCINIDTAHPLNISKQQCSRWLLQAARLGANVSSLPNEFYTFSPSMWTGSPSSSHPWNSLKVLGFVLYSSIFFALSGIFCFVCLALSPY